MLIALGGVVGAGLFAEIDDEDAPIVTRYSWSYRDGYAITKYYDPVEGRRRTLQMHRLVMREEDPFVIIDHEDRNRLNCKKGNLRRFTPKQNANNMATNRRVIAFGEEKTVAEWADDSRCKVSYSILIGRLRRWGETYPAEALIGMSTDELC